jgi:chemotaxis protein methyltransferase CheR
MQADGVPDALWGCLSEFIAKNTGLHFPPERRCDLQRGLTAAAAEFGFADSARCADWLLSAPLTRPQLHTLASHLTVGETYFFRERKTFDALAQHILPELLRRRRGREQRLRLWSAACSTGEEPYSLAILLQQLLPDWRDWHITILATDINPRSLQKAAAGVYGEWSFRESPAWFRERYFTRTRDGRFAVEPHIRDCVTFAPMNLAQDCFPSLASDTNAMDVIFCRNVLMYFTSAHARKVVENLRSALTDDGWLAVSPAECSQALFSRFVAVNFPDCILYRKCSAAERSSTWTPASSGTTTTSECADGALGVPQLSTPEVAAAAQTPLASSDIPSAPSQTKQGPQELSQLARTLANQGNLADALVWSERWINADKINPAAHYIHAMVLQETGECKAARRSLDRAVYLQPDFALAHFALGNLARAESRTSAANRHFANALHVLRSCPSDQPLPESEGMTAGRLTEIITTVLALPHGPLEATSNGNCE